MPPLDEGRSEVYVINMQSIFFSHADVDAQTAPLFASGHADVVILRLDQRETAEHEVAINSLLQFTVMSHAVVETQFVRDEMSLVGLAVAPLNAVDFLQRYDVGVNLF